MRRYQITLIVMAFVVISALGLSFTIVNTGSYKNSLFHRFTRQRFAWLTSEPRPQYAIRAGWASTTIMPTGIPARATNDSIQTRVLILDNGTTRAALITINLLTMPPTVAQALEQRLPRLGLAWKNVYLGVTHSQPGPGGWMNDYMGERQSGPYNQQRVNQLTDAIAQAVTLAQKDMAIVKLGYTQVDQNGQQQGSSSRNEPGVQQFHFLQLRKPTGESALIYSGSVAPETAGKGVGSTDRPDFSRLLAQQLEQQMHVFTLALAGPMEEIRKSPQPDKDPRLLASRIAPILTNQPLQTNSTLIAQSTPLVQNDPQIRISKHVRLKPWLAKALYGDYPAELKALRIGQTVFVGCPGGISVELANDLLTLPVAEQRQLVITSYNGGNLGQLVPDHYYFAGDSPYEPSQVNRFGPHTAEFLADMTQRLVASLK